MPTWWMSLPKNTRSPGCSALSGTWGSDEYCACDEGGSEWPAGPQAQAVRPEQSKLPGPDAPDLEGLPILRGGSSTGPGSPGDTAASATGGACDLAAGELERLAAGR